MIFDEEKEKSLFDNDDEFGVDSYRSDSSYIFNSNLIPVRIFRFNEEQAEEMSGNLLGITDADEFPRTKADNIKINIMSQAPSKQKLTEFGYDGKGEVVYEAYVDWDVEVGSKDIIEFMRDCGSDISAGERFVVKIGDTGLYQGKATRRQFIFTKIEDSITIGAMVGNYIVDELRNYIVDEIGDYIIF